jgi:ATP-binding cassette, subfamily C (CFTR/MRP), member 1
MVHLWLQEHIEKQLVPILRLTTHFLLFFASLFRSWSLSSRINRVRTAKSTRTLGAKLVSSSWCPLIMSSPAEGQILLGGCFTFSAVNLIVTFSSLNLSDPLIWSDVLEPFALAALAFLTFYNHQRTRRSSTIALLFWPMYTIEFLFLVQTVFIKDASILTLHFLLKCAVPLLGIVSLVLECLGTEEAENTEHPIVTANVYSRWFFTYVTPLLKRGASQYITEADLLPLTPKNDCENLGIKLQRARHKQCVSHKHTNPS